MAVRLKARLCAPDKQERATAQVARRTDRAVTLLTLRLTRVNGEAG